MPGQCTSPFTRAAAAALWLGLSLAGCSKSAPATPSANTFDTPEAAVRSLNDAVTKGDLARVVEIFGSEGKDLVDTSDPETARRNREVVAAAMREAWHLEDQGKAKVLIVGHEGWPFPVPLVKDTSGWRFDTAAGKEEVLARRIGRNELAVIRVCRTYVAAQRAYAAFAHDKNPKGVYAVSFRSDEGRQNGLYWPAKPGQPRSPLGALLQEAEQRAASGGDAQAPFHGYYFRILTGQGAAATGGAKDYVVKGRMTGGFALIAWPAFYDSTGVMTFIVNGDGVVYEKDLGPETDAAARKVSAYDPDGSWMPVN
jgi:hypothetical protein